MSETSPHSAGIDTNQSIPGTTIDVSQDYKTAELASRAGFLSLFILIAFIGNIVLVATITQSRSLRLARMNRYIVSLAGVNIVQCVINMPLVLGYTITDRWDYGDFICKLNSSFMQLLNVEMLLGISIMVLDRIIAVYNPVRYEQILALWKCNILVGYTWIHSLVFAIPLLTESVLSTPFQFRYLCSVQQGSSVIYTIVTSVICFVIPCLAILTSFALITKSAVQEKLANRPMLRDHHYTDTLIDETQVWKEIKNTGYVVTLFIIWGILEGPYLAYTHIQQFMESTEFLSIENSSTTVFPTKSLSMSAVEISFTWMKFSYCMVLPFATFFWRKDIWQKFKDLILCRKSNLIVDAGPRSGAQNNNVITNDKRKEAYGENTLEFKTPVLFATSHGILVKTDNDKEKNEYSDSQESEYFYADMTSKSNDLKTFKAKKCDVNGTQKQIQVDQDTSDYDSNDEIPDPFSVSDPSNLRRQSVENDRRDHHSRSRSDSVMDTTTVSTRTPRIITTVIIDETAPGHQKKRERKRNSSQQDSGVDSNFNSTEKRKKKNRNRNSDAVEQEVETHENDQKVDSNDSGRGSVKEIDKKKKKRKKISSVDADNSDELPTPRNDTDSPQNEGDKSIMDDSSVIQQSNQNIAKPKTKKKRKPINDSGDVEMSTLANINQEIEHELDLTLRPPARLKPLDHKGLKSNKTSPGPPLRSSLKRDQVPQSPIPNRYDNQNDHSEVTPSDHVQRKQSRSRTNSASASEEKTSPPTQRVSADETEQLTKRERRRRNTSDSQTALLGSGSSVDLRELQTVTETELQKRRKKKRVKADNKLNDNPNDTMSAM